MNMDSAMASKVLSRRAGPVLQSECTAYVNDNGTLPSGGIYTSDGHNLSCQYVVHVNCPNSPQVHVDDNVFNYDYTKVSLLTMIAGAGQGCGRLSKRS